jgi:hypothetical protein
VQLDDVEIPFNQYVSDRSSGQKKLTHHITDSRDCAFEDFVLDKGINLGNIDRRSTGLKTRSSSVI